MIYHLTFHTNHLTLPLAYHAQVQGLIYHFVSAAPQFSAMLHDKGYCSPAGRPFKLFCFSDLEAPNRIVDVRRKRILFPTEVFLVLRTADPAMAQILDEVLQIGTAFTLCGQPITLVQADSYMLKLTRTKIKIKMRSPVTVYTTAQRKTHYYTPLDREFPLLIHENFRRKWETVSQLPVPGEVQIQTLSVGSGDKCVTTVKNTIITAWGGTYQLSGPSVALELLYHTGIGAKNAMGFGLFDLMESH